MKILVIPDVHGTHHWEIAKEKINEVDKVVFLGDYINNWESEHPDEEYNLRNIFEFKKENPDKVKVLLGNHDWAVISGSKLGHNCSGYDVKHAPEQKAIFLANYQLLDVAAEFDGYVFSHAGFTNYWVKDMKHHFHIVFDEWPDDETGNPGKVWDEKEFSIKFLNDYFHSRTHIYGDDTFDEQFDELLDWHGFFSGSGDEIMQGPLWVRPASLLRDTYFPKQVVGHTEYAFYNKPIKMRSEKGEIILTDSADHSGIFILDTEKDELEPMTIPEFNRFMKRVEKTICDIASRKPKTKEEIQNYYNMAEYSQFFNKEIEEYILKKTYIILENTFQL